MVWARRALRPPPMGSLSGISFLSSTLFTLFTEGAARTGQRGRQGALCPPKEIGALAALYCSLCSSAGPADGIIPLSVISQEERMVQADSELTECRFGV